MSKNIKGITVEIGGNVTPLNDALGKVNKHAKDLQNELKFVNKALELDPTNIDLITQKQDVLRESIGNTTTKLETLKQAQQKLDREMKEGLEVDQEQYRKLQREIVFTENKLESYKNELNELPAKLQSVSKSIEEFGSKAESAGNKMMGISAISVGLLTGATTQAVSLEGAVNKYIASTGKGIESTEEFEAVISRIYSNNFGESFEEIANNMGIVTQMLGDLPTDQLEEITEKSMLLQSVYDMDFRENIRGLDAMMNQFGISADEALELINQGAQAGLNQNQDWTDQIAEYAVHWADLGFTAEDMLNKLIAGSQDGAFQIDYLNDAMKEFGIKVLESDDNVAGAFATLGLNAEDMKTAFAEGGDAGREAFSQVAEALSAIDDPLKQNELGVALFGTKFEDLGATAILAMGNATDSVDQLGDSLDKTGDIMSSGTGASMATLLKEVQALGAELGQVLLPIIQPIVSGLRDMVAGLSDMSPTAQKVVVAIMGIVGAIGPVLSIVGKISTSISGFMSTLGKLAPVIAKLKTVFTAIGGIFAKLAPLLTTLKGAFVAIGTAITGPIGIAVAVVAGLIAVFTLLYNKCEWFRNGVNAIWEAIKNAFFTAWDAITNFFTVTIPNVFNTVINFVKSNWQGLLLLIVNPFAGAFKLLYDNCEGFRTFVDNFVQNVKDFFINGWNSIVEFFTVSIPTWINNVMTWLSELPRRIGYGIGVILGNIIQFGIDIVNWITTNVPMFIENAINFLKELPSKVWNWLVETFNKIVQFGADTLAKAIEIGSNFLTKIIEFYKQLPSKIWEWLKETIVKIATFVTDVKNKAVEVGSQFIETVVRYIKELPSKIWTWLKSAISKVTTWVSDMKRKGKEAISGLINAVVEGAKDIPEKMLKIGKDIVNGVWDGILDAKDKFVDNVTSFFSGIVDGVKDALEIESPSKVFRREVGRWIPLGVAEGIDDTAGAVDQSIGNMFGHAVNGVQNGFNALNSQSAITGLMNGTNGLVGGATSNNYGQNTVNIYTESIDTQNIDRLVDVINRKLGIAY